MLTPKQPVINTVLITYIDYSITENYTGKMASFLPYTRPESLLKSSASHLLTFLVAQLQFLREWKRWSRRLYEVFERRLLILGNPKEKKKNSPDYYPFQKHAFFLRHPIYIYIYETLLEQNCNNLKMAAIGRNM